MGEIIALPNSARNSESHRQGSTHSPPSSILSRLEAGLKSLGGEIRAREGVKFEGDPPRRMQLSSPHSSFGKRSIA